MHFLSFLKEAEAFSKRLMCTSTGITIWTTSTIFPAESTLCVPSCRRVSIPSPTICTSSIPRCRLPASAYDEPVPTSHISSCPLPAIWTVLPTTTSRTASLLPTTRYNSYIEVFFNGFFCILSLEIWLYSQISPEFLIISK